MPYIKPGSTIGIIGGGQLGRMLAQSAKKMGYKVGIFDPGENCSAGQVADFHVQADFKDIESLLSFAKQTDILTFEFENISLEALERIVEAGAYLPQGSEILKIIQDRVTEKDFLKNASVPVADYFAVDNMDQLKEVLADHSLPAVLKTRRFGYDGKGQVIIKKKDQLDEAADLLEKGGPCVLESFVAFQRELSVMVFRNQAGDITTLPVSENLHINHILHQSIVPARLNESLHQQVEKIAGQVAQALNLTGVVGIELFQTSDQLLVNELAPRPHNSGHYSIEACEFSQFDLHIRAICGLPFPSNQLYSPALMTNILGQHLTPVIEKWPDNPDWHLHIYDKGEAKVNRKMGHITQLGNNLEGLLTKIADTGIWEVN